jgi:tetratricopeptide (TPR) repeat protein
MQRSIALPVLFALLVLPALSGCNKIQARAELKKGNTYYQQESYTKALDQYSQGLDLDPDATFAWRSLGLTALALYRPGDENPQNVKYGNQAIEAFEKYLADYPDDGKVQEYLMTMYVNTKRYNDALEFIDQQIQISEADGVPERAAELQTYKIKVLTQAGRIDQAWQLAQQTQGEKRAEMLYSVGVAAWDKAYNDPTFDAVTREKIVDTGLQAVDAAVKAKEDYFEAMAYYNLLYREKAKLALDANQRLDYSAKADEWQQKAIAARKKTMDQQAKQAAAETQG